MKNIFLAASMIFWTFGSASLASAATVDCATAGCLGGSYTLDVTQISTDFWQATYTIDTTGAFSVSATDLVDIEFKVANSYANPTLTSGPSGSVQPGPLGGKGCNGSNGGFVCINLNSPVAVGGVYTWTVNFGATNLLAQSDWHLGARYTSASHTNGWVISESPGAAVPEPTSALLFGAGIFVVSRTLRRRSSNL